jgi:RNA polymerase sigma-70 factor (ECF subfamily)
LAIVEARALQEPVRELAPRGEEQALAERAKCDPAAFEELYERYLPKIYRFVYSRVRDAAAAEDVTSDVFMKALRSIHRYHDTGSSFSAWLYRIALYSVVDRYRATKPVEDLDQLHELAADGPGPEDVAADRDELRRVWSVVEALPTNQRIAIALRFQEDMRLDDIAAAMDKSPAAVKQLLFRGLATVRGLITRE